MTMIWLCGFASWRLGVEAGVGGHGVAGFNAKTQRRRDAKKGGKI